MSAPYNAEHLVRLVAQREITAMEVGIIAALADSLDGLSASNLAEKLNSTPDSIKVLVCRARAKGLPIAPARPHARGPRLSDGKTTELYRLLPAPDAEKASVAA